MFKYITHKIKLPFGSTQRFDFLHDNSIPIMKPAYLFAAILFLASSVALSGCYTQLASSGGGYGYSGRVYHTPRPLYSDTVKAKTTAMRYDTTMHGDTMFIDEHPMNADIAADSTSGGGGEEIVNNYYDPAPYEGGFSIGFGWPYYSWYSPWYPYYSAWNYGWGYPGFYPPYYDAFWGPSFYYPSYNFGFYGGYGSYGRRFHNYGFGHGGYGSYRFAESGRPIVPGRLGGENRLGSIGSRSGFPGSIASSTRSGMSGANVREPNAGFTRSSEASSVGVDRNAPVHVMAPEGNAGTARSETSAGMNTRATESGGMTTSNGMAASHPIVVRRSDGQTVTSANVGGRQMTVVRRNGGTSNGSYSGSRGNGSYGRSSGTTGRGNGSGRSGGYRSSGGGRGYSAGSSGHASSGGGAARSGGGSSSGSHEGGGGGGRR